MDFTSFWKNKKTKEGVIPILRTERSIAPQRIGPAQLPGHAAKEGHADGVLGEYGSLPGRRFPRIPPPLNPSGSGWTRRQRLTGGVAGPPAGLLLPRAASRVAGIEGRGRAHPRRPGALLRVPGAPASSGDCAAPAPPYQHVHRRTKASGATATADGARARFGQGRASTGRRAWCAGEAPWCGGCPLERSVGAGKQ